MLHLRQAGLDVRHPADLLAAALEPRRVAPDDRTSTVAGECDPTMLTEASMDADRLESIAERLAAIEEELRDLAYDRLRDRGPRSRQRRGPGREQGREAARAGAARVAKAINALAPITVDA